MGKSFRVKNQYYPKEYKNNSKASEFDFAVLELEKEIGDYYGYLGIDVSEGNAEDVD